MLQYTIQSPGGCCGQGEEVSPPGACAPPIITAIKNTPVEAKAADQEMWCETRGGMYMCLPRTLCMAGWFKALQRAINDYAAKIGGIQAIRIDARIGPETYNAVVEIANAQSEPPPASLGELSSNSATWARKIAYFSGAPIDASPSPKPRPNEIPTVVTDDVDKDTHLNKNWWGKNWKWIALGVIGTASAGLGYSIYRKRRIARGELPASAARGI